MAKLAKSAVDYSKGKLHAHCGLCRHYEGNGDCAIVAGVINPAMWCNRFDARKSRASKEYAK